MNKDEVYKLILNPQYKKYILFADKLYLSYLMS